MRSNYLNTWILFSLAIAVAVSVPLKRQNARQHQQFHWARQVAAGPAQQVEGKTGYPAAGFRPQIPFELPNERQPKELPDVASTPATTVDKVTAGSGSVNVDVEVLIEGAGTDAEENHDGKVGVNVEQTAGIPEPPTKGAEGGIEIEVQVNEKNPATGVENHTPAIEYGPPVVDGNITEDESEIVSEPVGHFQPPNREAEEFATPTAAIDTDVDVAVDAAASNPNVGASAHPIADLPATEEVHTPTVAASEDNNSSSAPNDLSLELDGAAAEQHIPLATYGPPTSVDEKNIGLPANTYGAPGSDVGVPPEVEEEDFGVELNELEPVPTAEDAYLAAEQINLLSGFSELKSGRLIFVPSDGSNLRQIFFEAPSHQRRANKNGRLMRL